MKAAFFKTPGQVELREIECPRPREGEVLVRVLACGICGSDVAAYREVEHDWHRRGHEYSGVVEEVGPGVEKLPPGQLVAGIGSLPCGKCPNCWAGRPKFCLAPRAGGGDAFAEYVCKGEEFWFPVPDLSPEEAALLEPLTVALEMVRDGAVSFGSRVLLQGAGPIGLMALRLCKLIGAEKVYVSHPATSTARRKLAEEWGAEVVICPYEEDLVARMRALEPAGVDSVLITIKPSAGLAEAAQVAAPGGTLALIGMEWQPLAQLRLNIDQFHFAKLRLVGSNHNPCSLYYPEAAELLRTKRIEAQRLVSHRFPLTHIREAFEYLTQRRGEVVKVMVTEGKNERTGP